MQSEFWDKNSIKAFTTGYNLDEIIIFEKECEEFLYTVITQSLSLNGHFLVEEKTLAKANWMILNDIMFSLLDCLFLLKSGNIRMASRIFRDTMENMHLLELLNDSKNEALVFKWFNNEIIEHEKYRDWIKKKDEDLSNLIRDVYRFYSKYAHRTYKPISESFYEDSNKKAMFKNILDRSNADDLKLLSRYYDYLAYFVINTSLKFADYNVISKLRLSLIADNALK